MAKVRKNYTLGRGKLFLAMFLAGTKIPDGFLYFGNTPELSFSAESEDLPHFSADEGVREKDDGITLEVTRTGSFTTDNISPENIALFYFGTATTIATPSSTGMTYTIAKAKKGYNYVIGSTPQNPSGVRGIDPADFEVGASGGVKAAGTVTFAGVPAADDTVTVGDTTYTFKAGAVAGANEVLIAGSASAAASNLMAAINAGSGSGNIYGAGTVANADAVATVSGNVLSLTAKASGADGNTIALVETGGQTTASGATLTGGSGDPAVYTLGTDFLVNFDTGRIEIMETGTIVEGSDLELTYSLRASSRSRILSGNKAIEGALMYEANNPKGENFDYYMGHVSITPSGDYPLKGDEWQTIPFNIEILKPDNGAAITIDGRPAYNLGVS